MGAGPSDGAIIYLSVLSIFEEDMLNWLVTVIVIKIGERLN